MICTAHFPEDREKVINLWSSCFGDERNYIEFFLDNVPSEDVLFVYKEKDEIVGMTWLMPAEIGFYMYGDYRNRKLYYVYAVGVDKEYRNRGIAGKLLSFAKAHAENKEAGLCLVPADEGLVSYYSKRGFSKITASNREYDSELNAAENISASFMNSDVIKLEELKNKDLDSFRNYSKELYLQREKELCCKMAFRWSYDNFYFALCEHIYVGGTVRVKKETEGLEYMFALQEQGAFKIREILADNGIDGDIDFDMMVNVDNIYTYESKISKGIYVNFCFN
ncbi:MAG: GNAT family N-acetyltransferase [Lachnospiraceae bacterium]|nr:GNAT family N-acetyltransferase [Lachnospiraceae bacterium]